MPRADPMPGYHGRTGPKRSPMQREADRVEIARLYRMGWSQEDIAKKFGLTQQLISLELKKVRQQYIKDAQDETLALVGMQIAQHRDIIKVAWEAWEKSWQDETSEVSETKTVQYTGEDNDCVTTSKTVSTRKGRLPGQQYLDTIQRSIDAIAKLRGLYKEPAHGGNTANFFIDWKALATGKMPDPHGQLEQMLIDMEALPAKNEPAVLGPHAPQINEDENDGGIEVTAEDEE